MSHEEKLTLLQNELDAHIEDFNNHVKDDHERWDKFIVVQETNTKVMGELTTTMAAQVDATKDILEAWEAANGAIKVGGWLVSFLKWCSGLAVIGVGASWILDHLKI